MPYSPTDVSERASAQGRVRGERREPASRGQSVCCSPLLASAGARTRQRAGCREHSAAEAEVEKPREAHGALLLFPSAPGHPRELHGPHDRERDDRDAEGRHEDVRELERRGERVPHRRVPVPLSPPLPVLLVLLVLLLLPRSRLSPCITSPSSTHGPPSLPPSPRRHTRSRRVIKTMADTVESSWCGPALRGRRAPLSCPRAAAMPTTTRGHAEASLGEPADGERGSQGPLPRDAGGARDSPSGLVEVRRGQRKGGQVRPSGCNTTRNTR